MNQLVWLVILLGFLEIRCWTTEDVVIQTDTQNVQLNSMTDQMKQINRFSKEILFVSEKKLTHFFFFSLNCNFLCPSISQSLINAPQNNGVNVIMSPFSIWSVMLLVAEGASSRTYDQLKQTLYLPDDLRESRLIYKNIEKLLSTNSSAVEVAANQAVITDSRYPLQQTYLNTLFSQYAANFLSVDFQQSYDTAKAINEYLSEQTNGQINDAIAPYDLFDTALVLTSSIIFKGQWRVSIGVILIE